MTEQNTYLSLAAHLIFSPLMVRILPPFSRRLLLCQVETFLLRLAAIQCAAVTTAARSKA